jgi:GNAT superfamily N-acetyltransferase
VRDNLDTMAALLRQALFYDLPGIWRVRFAVTENTLAPGVLSDEDVIEHLQVLGRGWVMEIDERIIGFSIGNAQTGNIWALFVDPEHQGRGYGKQLHDVMIRWLWSQGLQELWLTTGPGTRAQRFYELHGWRFAGIDAGEARYEMLAPTAG